MRVLSIIPLAIALTLSGAATAAPQAPLNDSRMSAIAEPARASAYKPRPAEVAELQGSYALSNRKTFRISGAHRKLYGQLGQGAPTELIAVSENHFVSRDRQLTLEYRPLPFSDELVLTYPSDLAADVKSGSERGLTPIYQNSDLSKLGNRGLTPVTVRFAVQR